MEWSKEQVRLLIDLYRENKVLWDPTDPEYKNRNRKHDAWVTVAATMDLTKQEVECKMRKLIGQFQREEKKVSFSGSGAKEASRKWFAYKLLLFLKHKILPNKYRETRLSDTTHCENIQADEPTEKQEEFRDDENSTTVDTAEDSSTSNNFTATNNVKRSNKRIFRDEIVKSNKKKPTTYEMVQEAYNTCNPQGQLTTPQKKDEFDVFGECVAHSLRNLMTKHAKVVVKHEINNLLFRAELGFYDEPTIAYSRKPSVSHSSTSDSLNPSPILPPCEIDRRSFNAPYTQLSDDRRVSD